MDRRRTRTVVSRLLRQSILELCKASVPQEQGIEIDGIVCISIGSDDEQIVVKVHEHLGALSRATSSGHITPNRKHGVTKINRDEGPCQQKTPDCSFNSEYQRKRQNLHSIANTAKKMRLLGQSPDAEDGVGSTTKSISRSLRSPTASESINNDMPILTAIKTEITSDEEGTDGLIQESGAPLIIQTSNVERYVGNASLDTVVFRDLECEHCKLLLPTFEELQAHNDQEHKAHTCGYCWRSFLNFINYQQHLKSHRRVKIGSRSRDGTKDLAKRKKCGECGGSFRSFSLIIEHLRSAHHFDKCLTCITCEEYFASRETFVEHRKLHHSDVQQCRCENCEVYFTYVEYKHHERECMAADSAEIDSYKSKRPIQQRAKSKAWNGEADSRNITGEDHQANASFTGEITSDHHLQLQADNVLGQILQSEHTILEQTKALVTVMTKEPEKIKQISITELQSVDSNQSEAKRGEQSEEEEDEEQEAASEPAESEASVGDGSDFLSSLISDQNIQPETWNLSTSSATTPEKAMPVACMGPYRCQTCFYVVEQFEDFERHCFEMHSRYVCTYCAQTFANRRNLHRHIRRHIGDLPYKCDECGQRFYRDDNLRRHKLKHLTSVKFVCAYCSITCENKNKLTSHLIGGHAIDVLKVTDQEIMKHVVLKDGPSHAESDSQPPHTIEIVKVSDEDIMKHMMIIQDGSDQASGNAFEESP